MIERAPPTELDSARVLSYAIANHSVTHTSEYVHMVVDDAILGPVPALAIARNNYEPYDILLFFCDEEWNVLAASGYGSVAEAKSGAELQYRGISALWQDSL